MIPRFYCQSGLFNACFFQDKITPLYVAASLGFPEFVEFLLKEYAQINELDVYGR